MNTGPSVNEIDAARGYTLAALFEQSFARFAEHVAVTSEDGSWTYAEIGALSRRLAMGLHASGLGRGSRVAILAPPRPEYVVCYAAMARLGITMLTLNIRLHVDELAWCIESGRPDMVIAAGQFGDQIAELHKRCGGVRTWVCLDDTTPGSTPYAGLLDNNGVFDAAYPEPDDIHNILYTSGTTGRPKGAMISQSAAATRGLRLAQWFGLTPDDGFVGWLPMYHCAGDESLYGTFLTGGRFATFATPDIEQMFARIESERLSWTLLLPGVITTYLDHPARQRFDLDSMRFAVGYANMMPNVIERLTRECNMDFYDAFGQTESSYVLVHGVCRPGVTPSLRKQVTPLVEIMLADENMQRVEPGTPGECVVRGPGVMSGYLDDPEATADAFRGGWLHTGDILVENNDHSYSFVDRKKFLIKSGGENIYPAEIESLLATHPAVREICAFGVPDEKWGEAVKVVVVTDEGVHVSPGELIQLCREHLAGYKRPRYIEFASGTGLPRSATGKIRRDILAAAPIDASQAV